MPLDEAPENDANGEAEQTQTITIQKIEFTAGMPYKSGHVLNAAEASVLNQTYGENLRNNFSSRIKKIKDETLAAAIKAWEDAGSQGSKPGEVELTEAQITALRTEFDAYEAEYEFNGKRTGRVGGDPVMREARKIAKSKLMEKLKLQNIDPKSITEDKWVDLIAQVLDRNPAIKEEAQRRVEATKSLVADTLDIEI